ncbi:MAG: hypothetical protein OEQ25_18275, partial [Gammaproteobacteria bacterium]|nr:hypothetical protein [Gammaproteobacteria bacterium]
MTMKPEEILIAADSGSSGRLTVVRADDLRALEGVNISRSLSWERTAKDFSHAIRTLEQFSRCPLLVTVFGTDGAILYRNELGLAPDALLVFDPVRLEDGFASTHHGDNEAVFRVFTA